MATRRVWTIGPADLTPDQRRVSQLDTQTHHLVLGPAGSGKTLVLLYRARHLLAQADVPADRLRVLVYTNVLRSYLQSGFATVDLPTDVVQPFFTWVGALAKQLGVKGATAGGSSDYTARLVATLAEIERRRLRPWLDAVLVDEGQDLPVEAFRLLARASKHVTVMADYAQTIYDHGAHVSELAAALSLSRESTMLLKDLRNAPDVAEVAACFLDPPVAANYLRSQAAFVAPQSRRVPVLFQGTSREDEWDFVAGLVRREIERGKRIGILVPTRYLVYRVHKELADRDVAAVKVERWALDDVDFNELTPKVLTIHGGKGLTFDTVVMPHLTRRWYYGKDERESSRPVAQLLFVGCSRAREWLALTTCTADSGEIPELRPLQSLGEDKLVRRTSASPVAPDEDEDIDGEDLLPL